MNNFIQQIKVSYCKNFNNPQPSGYATLTALMLSDKRKEKAMQMQLMPISTKTEKKAQSEFKKTNFPVLFPCILFGGTTNEDVSEDAQIIIIDIDAKDNPGLSLDEIFSKLEQLDYVAAAATSIRGAGVYAVIKIKPTRSNEDFHNIAASLEYELSQIGLNIDTQCKNIARKRFFGYSARYYWRESEPEMYLPLLHIPVKKPAKNTLNRTCENYAKLKEIHLTDKRPLSELIKEIEDQKIDITGAYEVGSKKISGYHNWTAICFALVDEMGEDGREVFHRLSRFNVEYDYKEADSKYTHQLTTSKGEHTMQTVYGAIKRAGIVIEDFKKIEENNKSLATYYKPEKATIKRREWDYPKEWDMPTKQDAVYQHYRILNALENLESAILKNNSEQIQKHCNTLEEIGLNKIPFSMVADHAPNAYKILTS